MDIGTAVDRNREQVLHVLDRAIVHAMLEAWRRCAQRGRHPEEPDFLAELVMTGAPLMQCGLSAVLLPQGIRPSVYAVYCHQQPLVRYGTNWSVGCELGDLLFAHIHTDADKRTHRAAMLYQAKASPYDWHHLPRNDSQLELLRNWPEFEYSRPSSLSRERRRINLRRGRRGTRYLLVDNTHPLHSGKGLWSLPGMSPVGSCYPRQTITVHRDWTVELLEILALRAGGTFAGHQRAQQGVGWSRVIWDLLQVGRDKVFNRKSLARVSAQRVAGDSAALDGMFYLSSQGSPWLLHADIHDWQPREKLALKAGEVWVPPESLEYTYDQPQGTSIIVIETVAESG